MIFNDKNKPKIQAALDAVQTRAKTRLTTIEHIEVAIRHVERELSYRLYKKDWVGLEFSIQPHGDNFPGAYKGRPEGTAFKLIRRKSGWFVADIHRGYCDSPTYCQPWNITDKEKEIIEFCRETKNWN